jgi:hypothetical protein
MFLRHLCILTFVIAATSSVVRAQSFAQVQSYTCTNLAGSTGQNYCAQWANSNTGALSVTINGDCTNNAAPHADQGYRWTSCTYPWYVDIHGNATGTTTQPNPNGPGQVEVTLHAYGPTPASFPLYINDYGWSWMQCDGIGDVADAEGGSC